ncbi:hypothetical protein EV2_037090 [Malus domestica]
MSHGNQQNAREPSEIKTSAVQQSSCKTRSSLTGSIPVTHAKLAIYRLHNGTRKSSQFPETAVARYNHQNDFFSYETRP